MLSEQQFQSTLPRGSDLSFSVPLVKLRIISIHAPSRERLISGTKFKTLIGISIHAPSRERLAVLIFLKRSSQNFNPRSLAGATQSEDSAAASASISIHAPSRERLIHNTSLYSLHFISIHAPSRERLAYCRCVYRVPTDFNPRSLAGATSGELPMLKELLNFNPRSLAGATSNGTTERVRVGISIHAPSRERLASKQITSLFI